MSTELSLTIIAVSVVLLVIFAIIAAIVAIQLMLVLKKTTQTVELKVHPILDEANKIAGMASSTTETIKENIERTTPFFHSLGRLSGLMDDPPHRFKPEMHDNTMNINFGSSRRNSSNASWAEWVALGLVLLQKLRHK